MVTIYLQDILFCLHYHLQLFNVVGEFSVVALIFTHHNESVYKVFHPHLGIILIDIGSPNHLSVTGLLLSIVHSAHYPCRGQSILSNLYNLA